MLREHRFSERKRCGNRCKAKAHDCDVLYCYEISKFPDFTSILLTICFNFYSYLFTKWHAKPTYSNDFRGVATVCCFANCDSMTCNCRTGASRAQWVPAPVSQQPLCLMEMVFPGHIGLSHSTHLGFCAYASLRFLEHTRHTSVPPSSDELRRSQNRTHEQRFAESAWLPEIVQALMP